MKSSRWVERPRRRGWRSVAPRPAPDGSDQTRLTTSPDTEFGPAWSPDAHQIAYVRFVGGDAGTRTVYVMNADGSDQHPVHPGPGFQVVPAWQPLGTSRLDIAASG